MADVRSQLQRQIAGRPSTEFPLFSLWRGPDHQHSTKRGCCPRSATAYSTGIVVDEATPRISQFCSRKDQSYWAAGFPGRSDRVLAGDDRNHIAALLSSRVPAQALAGSLLLLLSMQSELLSLQVGDHLFKSLDSNLIADRHHYSAVPRNLPINLAALLTHRTASAGGYPKPPVQNKTALRLFCFSARR